MASVEMKNPFASARLVYRSLEDGDGDRKLFDEVFQKDAAAFALNDPGLLRPQSRAMSDGAFGDCLDRPLAVVVCLPAAQRAAAAASEGRPDDGTSAVSSSVPKKEGEEDASTPIGILTLDSPGARDLAHHRAMSLGITVAAPHRGRGFGREATDWALDWAFRHAGAHRVGLRCVEFNAGARRLYEGAGFVLEGRLRAQHFYDRRWWDVLCYSMLEDEWEDLRGLKKGIL